jgi:hypothetical protein
VKELSPVGIRNGKTLKRTAAAVLMLGVSTGWALAEVHLGLRLGRRTVFDEKIVETYGEGFLYTPFLRLTSERSSLGLEIAYEGGFSRDGTIGLFQENSTLSITGIEAAAIVRKRFGPIVPYLKAGIGYFFLKQKIDSQDVRLKVDQNQQQVLLGGGLDVLLPRGFYFTSEIKYVPLKVSPYGKVVDLGGVRFLAGVGFSFDLGRGQQIRDVD